MTTPVSQLNLSSVEHVWVEYHVAEYHALEQSKSLYLPIYLYVTDKDPL
jgi:hypothetical protein